MTYIKIILTVIAILLGMMNYRLWTWQTIPTQGDLMAIREAKDRDALMPFIKNIPVIHVLDGNINAEVSGRVSID